MCDTCVPSPRTQILNCNNVDPESSLKNISITQQNTPNAPGVQKPIPAQPPGRGLRPANCFGRLGPVPPDILGMRNPVEPLGTEQSA